MSKKYYYTSPIIKDYTHGFFRKNGGVSSGIYSSLNCGLSSKDKTPNVIRNRQLVAKYLNFDVKTLVIANQFHSNQVLIIDKYKENLKCDSIISLSKDITLGVLTADCCPILVGHKQKLIFATIHLGWKGLLDGILENFLHNINYLKIKPSDLLFALGPCITRSSYEVGDDLKRKFEKKDQSSSSFFSKKKNNKIFFDLSGYAIYKLNKLGLLNIWSSSVNTYLKKNNLFSYRYARDKKYEDYGRMLSIIKI